VPPRLGFTFSPHQATQLGVDWRAAYAAALGLGPALVRLGAYWSRLAPAPRAWRFDELDWLVERAAARGVPVLLTVGMKAPRWPEFYLPAWLGEGLDRRRRWPISDDPRVRAGARAFVETVVRRYRQQPGIEAWQVENEPLDAAGPHGWRVGPDFLREEIALVRSLDPRPVVATMFAHSDPLQLLPPVRRLNRRRARALAQLADVVGLDVYPAVAIRAFSRDLALRWRWWRWERPLLHYAASVAALGKPTWVTEVQAEPWEPGAVAHTAPGEAPSLSPRLALATVARLRRLALPTVLLWGVEHWYARRLIHDDERWWSAFGRLFDEARHPLP
jgi:Beta-galactosidase